LTTHVVIIEGLSGRQRYLARGLEVDEQKHARRFRSEGSATAAARAHIEAFPRVIQRQMRFEVRGVE
jgi:hypothetical protein